MAKNKELHRGIFKIGEECSELIEALADLEARIGKNNAKELKARNEEIADVFAVLGYYCQVNERKVPKKKIKESTALFEKQSEPASHLLTAKLAKTVQVAMKVVPFPDGKHPSAKYANINLLDVFDGSVYNLYAALDYYCAYYNVKVSRKRIKDKMTKFEQWGLSGIPKSMLTDEAKSRKEAKK